MVAAEPTVPRIPTPRTGRSRLRCLRAPFPEPAPNATGRGIGLHGLRRRDPYAADLVRESRAVRPPGLARGHLVHADRESPADSVHRAPASLESRVRRGRGTERSRNRGGARHHLERGRDRRDPRRALLRGARLAFRLTGAFFRVAFRGRAFFAGAFFGGAFAAGSRTGPSAGSSL